jgi:hypothetical protein
MFKIKKVENTKVRRDGAFNNASLFSRTKADNITKHHNIKGKEDAKLTETQSNNKGFLGSLISESTALLWYFVFWLESGLAGNTVLNNFFFWDCWVQDGIMCWTSGSFQVEKWLADY